MLILLYHTNLINPIFNFLRLLFPEQDFCFWEFLLKNAIFPHYIIFIYLLSLRLYLFYDINCDRTDEEFWSRNKPFKWFYVEKKKRVEDKFLVKIFSVLYIFQILFHLITYTIKVSNQYPNEWLCGSVSTIISSVYYVAILLISCITFYHLRSVSDAYYLKFELQSVSVLFSLVWLPCFIMDVIGYNTEVIRYILIIFYFLSDIFILWFPSVVYLLKKWGKISSVHTPPQEKRISGTNPLQLVLNNVIHKELCLQRLSQFFEPSVEIAIFYIKSLYEKFEEIKEIQDNQVRLMKARLLWKKYFDKDGFIYLDVKNFDYIHIEEYIAKETEKFENNPSYVPKIERDYFQDLEDAIVEIALPVVSSLYIGSSEYRKAQTILSIV